MIHDEDPATERTCRTCIKTAGVATTGIFTFSDSTGAHTKDDKDDSSSRGFRYGYKGEEKRNRRRKNHHAGYDFGEEETSQAQATRSRS